MSEEPLEKFFGIANNVSSKPSMNDLIFGAHKACLIYCAAKLDIVEHLFEKKMTADQLAVLTGTHTPSLHRLLRGLETLGVLLENDQRQFSVTEFGLQLKSGVEGNLKNFALHQLGPAYIAGGHLLHTIRTGEPAFEHAFGMPYFEYLNTQPELATIFANIMNDGPNKKFTPILASNYDFTSFKTIVDIGGGNGDFLIHILRNTPNSKGIVFDLGYVVENAEENISKSGVKDRCTVVGGSFFDFIPPEGDCYTAKKVFHDWNDEQCLDIFRNIRKVMKKGSKLLIIEMILPEGEKAYPHVIIDTLLMSTITGRERTREEFVSLFEKASLKLNQIYEIKQCPFKIMELELF